MLKEPRHIGARNRALACPLAHLCFPWEIESFTKFVKAALVPSWSCWLSVMLLGQISLLLLPISPIEKRPSSRRRLIFPIIVTAFLTGALHFLLLTNIAISFLGDEGLGWFAGGLVEPTTPLFFGVCIYIWLFWGLLFWWYSRKRPKKTIVQRLLMRSILELLIAIPAHVACRQREDCFTSFLGITTGIASCSCVLVLAYFGCMLNICGANGPR